MDFKLELADKLSKALSISAEEAYAGIEIPANSEMGDYSFPCFKLAKTLRKSPNIIAKEAAESIASEGIIESVESLSAYINFKLNKTAYVQNVIEEVLEKGALYGSSDMGSGKNVVMDYSSPNVAKPFHVGHLRTTVIGAALYNIYKFLGYNAISVNHLGDWGTQFGKMIVAYKNWGNKDLVEERGIKELVSLYVKFHDEADKNPVLNDEARNWLLKMQEGDGEALKLWKWIVEISMKEFNAVYDRLHIQFDYFTGESFYNDKMWPIVEELKEKNLLVESDGAMIVDLSEYNMPPCLILRSDGGTLYPTRDIAAAKYRKQQFDFYKSLYITGSEQKLHFAQWFKVLELMGYEWAKDMDHIPYGLVNLESGKLSTRSGNVIFMEDILNEAVNKTKEIIEEKNPGLANKEEVAEKVGIGAIIFNDLYNSRIKDVLFSWDRMLNFEGETAPYVQYTHARAGSILEKAGDFDYSDADYSVLTDDASYEVAKLLYSYPDKIKEAAERYEPYLITRHLVDIAQAFNKFYQDNSILNSPDAEKKARLKLTSAVKQIIKSGLALINVSAPEKM